MLEESHIFKRRRLVSHGTHLHHGMHRGVVDPGRIAHRLVAPLGRAGAEQFEGSPVIGPDDEVLPRGLRLEVRDRIRRKLDALALVIGNWIIGGRGIGPVPPRRNQFFRRAPGSEESRSPSIRAS